MLQHGIRFGFITIFSNRVEDSYTDLSNGAIKKVRSPLLVSVNENTKKTTYFDAGK